jgi:parallel beta-helix repeat protein
VKKIGLLVFVLTLLLPITGVIQLSAPVKAEPRTWTVDIDGPADFHTIQEAINVATSGDTVFVYNGTYLEWNLVLGEDNLSLIGENKDNTIIDGMNLGWILTLTAQNVTVTGFTIQKSSIGTAGVFLNHAIKSKISNNIIKNHDSGIYSIFSNGNVIENNWVANNNEGIILSSVCKENRVMNNNVTGNTLFAGVDLSNGAHDNEIENNNVFQNKYGILIAYENNSIFGNRIINNDVGIYEYSESTQGYKVFHNNFINNTKQVDLGDLSVNAWDNGLEGNYWSDYNGTDFNQDGIGDNPYIINGNNTDRYPLMGTFSEFPVTWEEKTYYVTTICNSAISAFQFGHVNRIIKFNVTGEEGTLGFCRISIPKALMNYTAYTVLVDGNEPTLQKELPCSNSTHEYLYFTYIHSTREVTITPEFLTLTLMLLVFVVLTIVVAIYKRKLPRTPLNIGSM